MARLTPAAVRELLDRHGIEPSRALGQNFVVDPNTIDRIVRLAGVGPGDRVVEVGPGLGALTLGLTDAGASVVAVEADAHLLDPLTEVIGNRDVRLVHADALDLGWAELLDERDDQPWSLVANLPYNIATPLVLDVLERVPAIERLTFLVQLEVAERLVAGPGTKTYGVPSVRVAYWATGKIVARVSPTVFHPRPRVDSALVQLARRASPAAAAPPDVLFDLVRQAFGQRRKMLRRSLAGEVSAGQFEAARVAPDARPETLALADWDRLALASVAEDDR